MPALINTNSQLQGVFDDFDAMWMKQEAIYSELNDLLFKRPKSETITTANYAWKESVPAVVFWDQDSGREHQMFRDRNLQITYEPFQMAIDVNRYDRRSDQLNDPKENMQKGLQRFHQLPQNGGADILNGVASTIQDIPLAFDGVNLFSTTADGSPRFGATGGNSLTATSFDFDGFTTDLYRAHQQFMSFLDPAGQIIWTGHDVNFDKMHVIVPPALNRIALEVSKNEYLRNDIGNKVSQGNILVGTFKVHISNLLTNSNAWFVLIEDEYWKPMALRQEDKIENFWADMTNSDRSRQRNLETLYADQRVGWGVLAPWTIIKFSA